MNPLIRRLMLAGNVLARGGTIALVELDVIDLAAFDALTHPAKTAHRAYLTAKVVQAPAGRPSALVGRHGTRVPLSQTDDPSGTLTKLPPE